MVGRLVQQQQIRPGQQQLAQTDLGALSAADRTAWQKKILLRKAQSLQGGTGTAAESQSVLPLKLLLQSAP